MVYSCSFCNGGGPPYGTHNVRTCELLKLATAVFIAQKGKALSYEAFKKAAKLAAETVLFGMEIVGTVATAGLAAPVAIAEGVSVMRAAYDLYDYARNAIDLRKFTQMSKRQQAKYLIQNRWNIAGDEAQDIAEELY